RPDAGRLSDRTAVAGQPALQPCAVELPERDGRDLHAVPVAVGQEGVEEDLACVADVHLLGKLVQGGDEHRGPEAVDRAGRLAVPPEPGGEGLARPLVLAGAEPRQAVGDADLLMPTQESGSKEAAGQVKGCG